MLFALIFTLVFLIAYIGVGWFRAWSLKRGLLDIPNQRSSHVEPTPRGGGLVIAFVTLSAYAICSVVFEYSLSIGYIVGAILIVAVSFLDDVYSIPVVWRLLIHSLAAGAVIYSSGYISVLYLPFVGSTVEIGYSGIFLSFVWIVWLINSYNFMDGIDGIAGVQAVAAGIGWVLVGLFLGSPAVTVLGGATAFASFAFLFHNWQPARIFMGDAGSAFLGFTFASIPLLTNERTLTVSGMLPFVAVFFVWMFFFDSMITLLSRLIRGEKLWNAHRSHFYQRMVISGRSHQFVSLLYGALAVVVMLPSVFLLSDYGSLEKIALPAVGVVTIVLIAVSLGAGEPDNTKPE